MCEETHASHRKTIQNSMAGPRPVVISGPSGAGKSTLLKLLLKEYEQVFGFSVSHTTRNPRPGEENGKGEVPEDRKMANIMLLFKKACREKLGICRLASSTFCGCKAAVQAVQAKNQICILDIDMQGVKNIKRTDLSPIYLSIQPPSFEILEERLKQRKTESKESLERRLTAAKLAIEFSKEPGMFDMVIINDNLEDAYSQMRSVLLEEIKKATVLQN
ncbi:guanylate kinase isoform X3 [Narcine bancroftii]|uniref:guanylate kinase isoform X3 n=1 Tax=Narcine bancroftii TaxID=1343680 RepID=UPI003831F6CA